MSNACVWRWDQKWEGWITVCEASENLRNLLPMAVREHDERTKAAEEGKENEVQAEAGRKGNQGKVVDS